MICSVLYACFLSHSVVCGQLGLGIAIRADYFVSRNSSMPIWLDEVWCTTGDRYLSECSHNGWRQHDCSHSGDAGVVCNLTGLLYV